MTDKKLIDLMIQAKKADPEEAPFFEFLADFLLANGVAVQQWTPASQPPEVSRDENGEMVNYLVCTPEYGVDIGNYMEPGKFWICLGIPCNVTHWMPLPVPPKEGRR